MAVPLTRVPSARSRLLRQDSGDGGDKIARVIEKLSKAVAERDYYGALQIYRTVVQRKFDADDIAGGTHLLVLGARTLAAAGKYAECFDLGDMLLKIFADTGRVLPVNVFTASAIIAVADAVRPPAPSEPTSAGQQLVTADRLPLTAKAAFCKRALRWATANARCAVSTGALSRQNSASGGAARGGAGSGAPSSAGIDAADPEWPFAALMGSGTGSASTSASPAAATEPASVPLALQPRSEPSSPQRAKRILAALYLAAARAARDAAMASLAESILTVSGSGSGSTSGSSAAKSPTAGAGAGADAAASSGTDAASARTPLASLQALSTHLADAEAAFVHSGDAAGGGDIQAAIECRDADAALVRWSQLYARFASAAAAAAAAASSDGLPGAGAASTAAAAAAVAAVPGPAAVPACASPAASPMVEYAGMCLSLCLAAYRREADFFLAKPALQLASMGSLRDANAFAGAFAAGIMALMAAQAEAGWGSKAASADAAARAAAEAVAAATTLAPPTPTGTGSGDGDGEGVGAGVGSDGWNNAEARRLGAAALALMRAQSAAFSLPAPEAHPPLPAAMVLGTPLAHFTGFALQAMEVRTCPMPLAVTCSNRERLNSNL